MRYVSGFANSQGGSLLIGVDDNGVVVGVENAKKLLENLPNKIVSTTGVIPEVSLLEENGKEYIKISIGASNTPVTFNGRLYLRSGSTLQEMDGMAAQNFLLGKMGISWDAFKDAELEIPTFVEEFSGVTANIKREVFYAIQHGARIDDRTGRVVKAIYDTNDDTKNITERQRLIYNLLAAVDTKNDTKNDTKTTGSLAVKVGISLSTVKRELKILQERGFIEHCGPTNGGYWKVLTRK